jgi:hypothetical protein
MLRYANSTVTAPQFSQRVTGIAMTLKKTEPKLIGPVKTEAAAKSKKKPLKKAVTKSVKKAAPKRKKT